MLRKVYSPRRLALSAGMLVIVSGLLGARIDNAFSDDNVMAQIEKYNEVLMMAQKYYVDKVDVGELNEAAINGLLNKLDPHSVYMPPKNVKESAEQFEGKFEGIGITFTIIKDTITVDAPIPGGPSDQLGILAGDKIVTINGETSVGFKNDMVSKALRGPKGTKVKVGVMRAGIKEPMAFEITRDVIPIVSVMASFMVDDKTGYLDIGRFAATTYDEMRTALDKLKDQGMQRLVLDLRGNPGGYLEQAVRIADEFIGGNKVIVKTKGRVSAFDDVDLSTPGQPYESTPIVVLIDGGSASASEIVSGAIQDHDRGLVVGQTSFGKGLVQRQFPLNDGSALRLTISRYFTPSDRSIQKPYEGNKYAKKNLNIENPAEGLEDMIDNLSHDKEATDTTRPKYKTMGGRTVLGGGGITPDFLVKQDTTQMTTRRMIAASVIYDYLQSYVGRNAASLKKQYNAESFERNFQVTEAMVGEILDLAKEKKVEIKMEEFNVDKAWLMTQLRAEIGGRLFGSDLRYKIYLETDKQFQRAISLIGEAAKMAAANSSNSRRN